MSFLALRGPDDEPVPIGDPDDDDFGDEDGEDDEDEDVEDDEPLG
jgi:hypothetical protein